MDRILWGLKGLLIGLLMLFPLGAIAVLIWCGIEQRKKNRDKSLQKMPS